MKKTISFIGAFLFGYAAFAQVSKTDTTKTPVRKVLASDVKNLSVADSSSDKKSKLHGYTFKGPGNQMLQKGSYNKKAAVADKPAQDN